MMMNLKTILAIYIHYKMNMLFVFGEKDHLFDIEQLNFNILLDSDVKYRLLDYFSDQVLGYLDEFVTVFICIIFTISSKNIRVMYCL